MFEEYGLGFHPKRQQDRVLQLPSQTYIRL